MPASKSKFVPQSTLTLDDEDIDLDDLDDAGEKLIKEQFHKLLDVFVELEILTSERRRDFAKLTSHSGLIREVRLIKKSSSKHAKHLEQLEASAVKTKYAGAATDHWEWMITQMRQFATAHPDRSPMHFGWIIYTFRLALAEMSGDLTVDKPILDQI